MAARNLLRSITGLPQVDEVNEERVVYTRGQVTVELDLDRDGRLVLAFSPYQALRVTTIDCFDVYEDDASDQGEDTVVKECTHSTWLEQLSSVLAEADASASFMSKSRHFVIVTDACAIEVAAWSVTCTTIGRAGTER